MIEATGSCAGIENYSRYLTGRRPGEPPPTLFEYIPDNALLFVDESHETIPQIGGMYRGDYRRKVTLAEYGFRLPSCMDNRPLRFEEWEAMRPLTVARLGHARRLGDGAVRRRVRRAGDPPHRPDRPAGRGAPGQGRQVDDVIDEIRETTKAGYRTLVTVLTKKMAEDLTEYMHEQGLRVRYMHSDVDTLERIEIIRDLRLGAFDILVGINLLREGLDIPECGLVAILDADKEGFLRSETSLIQTIGRAARNVDGKVILYADQVTGSMERAMAETDRRREKQTAWNAANGITPESVKSRIKDILDCPYERDHVRADIAGVAEAGALVGNNFKASSSDLETGCATPPPTSSSRRPPACATRSSGCATPSWPSPMIRSPARSNARARSSGREKGSHNKGRERHRRWGTPIDLRPPPRALFPSRSSTRWAAPATMRRRRARLRARCSRSSRSARPTAPTSACPAKAVDAVPQERSRRDDRAADRKAARSRAGAPGGGRPAKAGPARTVGPRQL